MKIDDFVNKFYSGTLGRSRTNGQYTVYDKNLLTGEDFSCHVLMRDPTRMNVGSPEWVGSYFGEGVGIFRPTYCSDDVTLKAPASIIRGDFGWLWSSADVSQAGLVSKQGNQAVVEVEGTDYLMCNLPSQPTSATDWVRDSDLVTTLLKVPDRAATVEEAKRLILGDIDIDLANIYHSIILTPSETNYDWCPVESSKFCPHPAGFGIPSDAWPKAGTQILFDTNNHFHIFCKEAIHKYNEAIVEWAGEEPNLYGYSFSKWTNIERDAAIRKSNNRYGHGYNALTGLFYSSKENQFVKIVQPARFDNGNKSKNNWYSVTDIRGI